jgi:hypothetical protein
MAGALSLVVVSVSLYSGIRTGLVSRHLRQFFDVMDTDETVLVEPHSPVMDATVGRRSADAFREQHGLQNISKSTRAAPNVSVGHDEHMKVIGSGGRNISRISGKTFLCPPREGHGTNREFRCRNNDTIYAALSTFASSKWKLKMQAKLEGFTVLISTYDRDSFAEECALYYATCPFVKQIDVVFHNPTRPPPPNLLSLVKRIGANSTSTNFRLVRANTNRISNRFNMSGVSTRAVFSIDDDRKVPCSYMTEAFLLWIHMGDLAFVMPLYDAARWIDFQPSVHFYNWNGPSIDSKYNTGFVTQGGVYTRSI